MKLNSMMMISKGFCCALVIAILLMFACSATAAAAEGTGGTAVGYTVSPDLAFNEKAMFSAQGGIVLRAVYGNIGPGERVHHTKTVSGDITTLNVDLKWYNPGVGLKLLVYSPGGAQFGPWSDGSDGRLDREINMDIDNPGGIEKGRWEYYVIYDTGTERTDYVI